MLRLNQNMVENMSDRFLRGDSIREIGNVFGLSDEQVRYRIHKLGLQRDSLKMKRARNMEIVAERNQGIKFKDIAAKHGITKQRAQQIYSTYS